MPSKPYEIHVEPLSVSLAKNPVKNTVLARLMEQHVNDEDEKGR